MVQENTNESLGSCASIRSLEAQALQRRIKLMAGRKGYMLCEHPPCLRLGQASVSLTRMRRPLSLLSLLGLCFFHPYFSLAQSGPPEGSILTSQAAVIDPGSHTAYVVDTQHDALIAINSKSHTATIKVGKGPIALAVDAATSRIYVANHRDGTVSVVDGNSEKLLATIPVDKLPYSIAIDQRTNEIFVSSVYSDALKIIDGATNAVTSFKAVSADAMAVNADAGHLYLMSYESAELTVFDIASRTFSKVPMGAMHLWAIARNPATSVLYVSRIGNADVVAYDEMAHTSKIIKTGKYPCALAINSKTNRIYVVNYADQSITVIDGAANSVLATLPVGDHPQAVTVNEASNQIYVANVHGDSVTVIDCTRNVVADTLHAGKNPYGIVVDKTTGMVATVNQGEPSFTLIDAAHLRTKQSVGLVR
jgi:YVTN family beta-propeller protein